MRRLRISGLVLVLALAAGVGLAQQTPRPMVATYDSLADAILALKQTEADFVSSVLQVHLQRARDAHESGDFQAAAAEMTLFASEGDNAIQGVRNRLLEGGHHHHAGDDAELYDPGYVVVTREARREIVRAAAAMRDADGAPAARLAWQSFEQVAADLVSDEM